MLRVAKRDESCRKHARMPFDPRKRPHELRPIIHAGNDDDLHVHLETGIEQSLEHFHATRCVFAHERFTHVRTHRMQ